MFVVKLFIYILFSTGKIELCASNATGFKNESTLLAFLGEPLTVSFCVQCGYSDRTLDRYIKIEHPNYRDKRLGNYYTNSTNSSELMVNIFVDKCTARVNITIGSVAREDITSVFAVTVSTVYQNGLHDGTVFTFQLTHAGNTCWCVHFCRFLLFIIIFLHNIYLSKIYFQNLICVCQFLLFHGFEGM